MEASSSPKTSTQPSSSNHPQTPRQEPSTQTPGPVSSTPVFHIDQAREESAILEEPENITEPRPLARRTSVSSRPASVRSTRSKSGFTISRKPVPGFLGRYGGITQSELLKSLSFSVHFPRSSSLGRQSVVEQIGQIDQNLFIGSNSKEPDASRKKAVYVPLYIRQNRTVIMSSDNITVVGSDSASVAASILAPALRRESGTAQEPKPGNRAMVYQPAKGLGQQKREAKGHQGSISAEGTAKSIKKAFCCCVPK